MASMRLDDVIGHIEGLRTFTQQALNDSNQAICLLNSEFSMMREAVLQNHMALDILTASQGDTCAITKTEGGVFILDESFNVTYLMNHIKIRFLL